jgi:formamidopyrimidine-DNA glycosylase
MELVARGQLAHHPALGAMGPEPLGADFNADSLARACAGKRTPLKSALLDQRVVAGLGNIYASEALHVAGLSPRRAASSLATMSGAPREGAHRLASAIKRVLEDAIARLQTPSHRSERFLVYDREGQRCSRSACAGVIRRRVQGGRSTFFCSVCQH